MTVLDNRADWRERVFRFVFGITLGDFRWGLSDYVWVALAAALWAITGGYVVLLMLGRSAGLPGEADGFLTSTLYIRNIEATVFYLAACWGPIAVLLNARSDHAQALSAPAMGMLCGLTAVIFRLVFLVGDNPMAGQDLAAWLIPFALALFTVIPAGTLAQRLYLKRRLAWEQEAEYGGSRAKPEASED